MKDIDGDDKISSSIISTTRYGHNSAKILRSIERNFIVVMIIIAATLAFSAMDTAGLLKYLDLYSENAHDTIMTIFSIISFIAMIPLLSYVIKSRRLLERWQDLFERNSLKASLKISLTGISKREIVRALSESLREICEPLQEYLDASEDADNAAAVFKNERYADFEVLIDPDAVGPSTIASAEEKLKTALKEFGSICVKVSKDEKIDAIEVESFLQSLSRYSLTSGNPVGLGLLIGQNITPEAYRVATSANMKRIRNIMLLEKPVLSNLH